jgi:serine/threonine protein kinase
LKNLLSLFTGKKSPIKLNATPARIGDYSVVRQIGSGVTSNVYLGIHEKTFASVAIKLLRSECKSDVHNQMFATEASLCGLMDHPNIVSIYKANLEAEEGAYLVMEYVDGQSLDKFSKPSNLLPIDFVIDAIKQSAEALRHASEKGIVHRDVKPDNLIRSPTGHVKLTDFGCAITIEPNAAPIPVAGSVAYMSPEQLTGKALDHQSDIYSLGAVFYRLLTGYYSFDAFNSDEAVRKILKHPHVSVESRRQGIPGELSGIIDKALEKNPADRHKTWGEFIREIEQAQLVMRTKYDYDYDMLRGFCDITLKQYLADQHEDMLRGYCDLAAKQSHTDEFELPGEPGKV